MKLNVDKIDLTGIILIFLFASVMMGLIKHGKVVNNTGVRQINNTEASKIDLTALDK